MKILTKEEEQAHYHATLKGGVAGAGVGLALGGAGVWLASRRFHTFRQLTVPFRAFLVASSATFVSIIAADRTSSAYDIAHNPEKARLEEEKREREELLEQGKTQLQLAKEWAQEHRYSILFGLWVVSMGGSFAIVNRQKYMTGAQKLVQARMYAQGLTLAALLGSFSFEANDATKGKGRWETIKVLDPNDPTHKHLIEKRVHHERYAGEDQWREMVEAEEARINARKEAAKSKQQEHQQEKGKETSKAKAKESKEKADKKDEAADKKEEKADKKDEKADGKEEKIKPLVP